MSAIAIIEYANLITLIALESITPPNPILRISLTIIKIIITIIILKIERSLQLQPRQNAGPAFTIADSSFIYYQSTI